MKDKGGHNEGKYRARVITWAKEERDGSGVEAVILEICWHAR